jgi:predicted amidohydrolase YtcJ
LVFGSDAPVESPNPFIGLHAAVTRRRQDGSPGLEGWYPEQRLSLDEALGAYTSGPAFAGGLESVQGNLKSGFLADLIVLDSDPYALPSEALADVVPIGTMVDGVWRHRTF